MLPQASGELQTQVALYEQYWNQTFRDRRDPRMTMVAHIFFH